MTREYDFQNLSFDDFERLIGDLLSKELGIHFESFKTGRDGGVDLRFAPSSDRTIVVQCKKYAPNAFSRLMHMMRTEEIPKVVRLNPARYVLVTACGLTPGNKDELLAALSPYCLDSGDIYGATEINALVRKHGDIEKKHFKLWMGSTAILERVLHAGIYNYSMHEVQRLRLELSRYVVHDGFFRALQMLDVHHHCVILGMPGIGKTTAARLLLAHYLNEDFEIISVTGDIEEAWQVIETAEADKKLVVYYDDFLGQIGHVQKLGKNEDRRLLGLLEHCSASKTKRFILTTREYLFDQALDEHEPLSRASEEIRRSTVMLDDYTMIVRARLLINHLTFSNLPANIIEALVTSKTCARLIHHENFLPRLIEGICSDTFLSGKTPETFGVAAVAQLEDPASVWKHPFHQLTREAQLLLYALASLDGEHEKTSLESAYTAIRDASGAVQAPRYFNDVLHEVEGSFTTSQRHPARAGKTVMQPTWMVRFINPSAREFVLTDAVSRSEILQLIFGAACQYRQALFWEEARLTFSGQPVSDTVRPLTATWFGKGLTLLQVVSPELVGWKGQFVEFQPAISEIGRLKQLFNAAESLDTLHQQSQHIAAYIGADSTRLRKLFTSFDVYWLPEVTSAFILAMKAEMPNWREILKDLLAAIAPGPYGTDLRLLRFHWEAAQLVIEASGAEKDTAEPVRSAFVVKAEEAADEITDDLSSDEIEDAADHLDVLQTVLDPRLQQKRAVLASRKKIAVEREEQKESEVKTEELSEAYASKEEIDEDSLDIDELFGALAGSLRERE